jgi:CheY-like chemotaxis protein
MRILVVEDHLDTMRLLAMMLDHFGHQIATADSRRGALRLLRSQNFDVVVSDIKLPDGTGYDVVSQAKRKRSIKAVAITGLSRKEDVRRSKEAGFDFHLSKPVDFQELRSILNQVGAN